jgi:hypothetical protein
VPCLIHEPTDAVRFLSAHWACFSVRSLRKSDNISGFVYEKGLWRRGVEIEALLGQHIGLSVRSGQADTPTALTVPPEAGSAAGP